MVLLCVLFDDQAAVAFGSTAASGSSHPLYANYRGSTRVHNPHHPVTGRAGSFTSRASHMATYGSLQDVVDEEDDEDAF